MQNSINNTDQAPGQTEHNPHQKLHEVEELTNTLKRLLVNHETVLDEEGIRHEVEILERWMESYRRGLNAADKISETGVEWLSTLRDRLKLAADERQRLEAEGGNPANKEQAKRTDELLEAARRIDLAINDIAQIFTPAHEEEPA